jgi:hypothetical protein
VGTIVQQHGSASTHQEPVTEAAVWETAAREGFEELVAFIRKEAGSIDAERAVLSRLAVLGAALVKSLEVRRAAKPGRRRSNKRS